MTPRMNSLGGILRAVAALALIVASAPGALVLADANVKDFEPPLWFEANEGQISSSADFYARGPGYMMFFEDQGPILRLRDDEGQFSEVAIRFQNGAPNPRLDGVESHGGHVNYFMGNDSAKWKTHVPTWSRIAYREAYPGIDVMFYGKGQDLEYDFEIAPGVDPSQIALAFDGANALSIESDGLLSVQLGDGEIHFNAPIAFQEIGGYIVPVRVAYRTLDDSTVGFELGEYDPDYKLTIDPVLVYSTYLGGSNVDWAEDIVVDSNNVAYVVGTTFSSDIPTSPGVVTPPSPPQGRGSVSASDIFVAQIEGPNGSDPAAVRWVSYVGQVGGIDEGTGIDLDDTGVVYVSGTTQSTSFPLALQIQSELQGASDAVGVVLSNDGATLFFSSYIGGSGAERGTDVSTGDTGRFVITGETASSDFPTLFPIQDTFGTGGTDGFAIVLGPPAGGKRAAAQVYFSSYFGGSGADLANAVDWNSGSNVMAFAGTTSSPDLPQTAAIQGGYGGGVSDAFMLVVSGDVTVTPTVVLSTFVGGSGPEEGNGVASGGMYEACMTGSTGSFLDFPVQSPLQAGYGGGVTDAFLTAVDYFGGESFVQTSGFFGGSGADQGNGIAFDGSYATLVGTTASSDFPTLDPFLFNLNGPTDAFVAQVYYIEGTDILFSSYYGGSLSEEGLGIALGPSGSVFICGRTTSSDLPLVNEAQDTLMGTADAFVAEIDPYGVSPTPTPIPPCEDPKYIIYTDDVETSPVTNWSMTGLWHRQENSVCITPPATSGNSAFAFNIEGQCTYESGGISAGSLQMIDEIKLPSADCVQLVYQNYVETEDYAGYDMYSVWLSVDGGAFFPISENFLSNPQWTEARVDLTPYANRKIRLRFDFDTVDDTINDYVGWYIDDVQVVATNFLEFVSAFIINTPGQAYVVFRDEFDRNVGSYVVTVAESATPGAPFYSQTFDVGAVPRAPAGPPENRYTDVFSLPLNDGGNPSSFEGDYVYVITGYDSVGGSGSVVFTETGTAKVPSTSVDNVSATRNPDDSWTIRFTDSRPTGSANDYNYYLYEQSFFTTRDDRAIQTELLVADNGRDREPVESVGTPISFEHTYTPTPGNKGWYVRSLRRYYANNGEDTGLSDVGFISPYVHGTIPYPTSRRDTDGDGFSDELELAIGTSPKDPAERPLFGDFNRDGHVNMADAIQLARATTDDALVFYDPLYDINADGQVDSVDADVLVKWAIGKAGYDPLPLREPLEE
ncbi:SBBP repeat-containing protein [bacterium]|nr:SBBP repeat-containing protein [bacterium]